jgi:hypothetical protein
MGYIARGAPALVENRTLQDLWQRKAPLLFEATSYDPNRDSGDRATGSQQPTRVSASAFHVGPVLVHFGKDPAASSIAPLEPWVNPERTLSNTSELLWNAQLGFCTINATHVQGVAAHFASAPTHQLKDVRFSSGNTFGAAMAVSLDGAPLGTSKRVLLQYATQSRPNGWRETPSTIALEGGQSVSGFTVQSVGQSPWQVQRAQLDVTIKNQHLRTATVLDMNGMPVQTLELKRTAEGASLQFPPAAMYVVLQ